MNIDYYLPDWEDRLDPDYNFQKDEYSPSHTKNPYSNDVYAHNILDPAPYDGILYSLGKFLTKMKLDTDTPKLKGFDDIKEYLKIDGKTKVMGDCGAFSYKNYESPPQPFFDVKNVAKIYDALNFDFGVSVDHVVVNTITYQNNGNTQKIQLSNEDKMKRIKITIENAREFLRVHENEKYEFTPIGVAQGYNIETYESSIKALIDLGYEYVALGSLIQYDTPFIVELLERVEDLTHDVDLHLFGISRPEGLDKFKKLGVTSFDSASYFRKAFLDAKKNYLSSSGVWYSAIRVPYSSNKNLVQNGKDCGFTISDLERMESRALRDLFRYEKGAITIDEVLKSVIKYDKVLIRKKGDIEQLEEKYRLVLEDKPWKYCKCNICRNIGINVVIFRGTNRNKRRGFHNTWVLKRSLS